MLSEQKFKEGMAILCETFGREASEFLLKGYWMVLRELSDPDFEKAIGGCLATKTFNKLPLPAEILEAASGNIEDKAVLALAKVREAIDQHGAYQTVVFVNDPEIHMVVEAMGGWEAVNAMTDEDWKFQGRKEFIALYKAFLRNPKAEYSEKLLGYHERNNTFNGLVNLSEPVYIGGSEQKKQIEGKTYRALAVGASQKALVEIGGWNE